MENILNKTHQKFLLENGDDTYIPVNKVPWDIKVKALFYPVVDYRKEHNCDKTINLARGETTKTNNNPDNYPDDVYIGKRFVGFYWGGEECNTIQVYLGRGYFKLISRIK